MALAHSEGVVHRDIKPANLMLVADRRGQVQLKLLDFGIAKLMGREETAPSGQTATRATLHAFSPHAAAPEQISGTRTGPWTDVHALALVVSEMVTGCAPYVGSDATEIYSAVLGAQRPTPAKHGFDVGAWEPVLAKALALKPADRYRDAQAFADALAAEVPTVVEAPRAGPTATLRSQSGSNVVTTLRPASRRTGSVVPSPRRLGPIVAACIGTGLLVGVAAWQLGAGAPSRASRTTPGPLSPPVRPVVAVPDEPVNRAISSTPTVGDVRGVPTILASDAGAASGAPAPTRVVAPVRRSSTRPGISRTQASPEGATPGPPRGPQRPSEVPVE